MPKQFDRRTEILTYAASIVAGLMFVVILYYSEPMFLRKSAINNILVSCGDDLACKTTVHEHFPRCFEVALMRNSQRKGSWWSVDERGVSGCIHANSELQTNTSRFSERQQRVKTHRSLN